MYTTYFTTNALTSTTTSSSSDMLALLISQFVAYTIFYIILYVFTAICNAQIFKKAGVKPYIAWIPFYNTWKFLEIGGQNGAYIFFSLIPFVGSFIYAIFAFIAAYRIGKNLGKSGAFLLLNIFLFPVWYIWLAVDKSKWKVVK